MTAETYLSLNSNTRSQLGDNIALLNENCVPIPVFNGEPPKKMTAAFETLATVLHHAAIREDTKEFSRVLRIFNAEQKTPNEIMALIQTQQWSKPAINWARKEGYLSVMPRSNPTTSDKEAKKLQCHKLVADNSQVELYALLNGRVTQNEIVTSYTNGVRDTVITFASTSNIYVHTDHISHPETGASCSGINKQTLLGSLSATGMNLISNGSGSDNYSKMKSWLDKNFPTNEQSQKTF
jgi:hypothetical protein